MSLKPLLIVVLLLAISACTVSKGPLATGPNDNFQLHPGVIADLNNGSIFLLNAARQLEAIDPLKGNSQWQESEAIVPLLTLDGSLVGRSLSDNGLNLVTLDPKNGATEQKIPVKLPDELDEDYLRNNPGDFTLIPYRENDEQLLAWTYRPRIKKGIYDPDEQTRLFGGTFAVENQGQLLRPLAQARPVNEAGTSILPAANQRIDDRKGQQFISRDGRHLLVSQKFSNNNLQESYRWEIYAIGNDKPLGQLNSMVGYASFFVVNGMLIFVEGPYEFTNASGTQKTPLQLVAYDLRTGKRSWTKALFDSNAQRLIPS